MTVLLVDDLRTFADGRECVVARSSAAAIRWLEEHPDVVLDELWLDHDLGGLDTGRKVVEYMELHAVKVDNVIVHSSNPAGARAMLAGLERAHYQARQHWDSFMSDTFAWIPPEDDEFDPGVPA